jgi:diadenosine tetraphosphate (Ap4A) HIT family hydrolase
MSQWRDSEAWKALLRGETCPICRQGAPRDVIAQLEASWVTMGEDSPVRGYACLVFRRHAVELHDLDEAEGAAFMRDAQRLSRALAVVTGAVKMNYEVHGNTLPHLHMHFFPRYVGDRFEGKPIDPRATSGPVYAPGEFERVRGRVVEEVEG